jgi:predicted dehydrogenase
MADQNDGMVADAGRPMRVGVIGTGFGARVVAPAFEASGCEVVDVVSARDPRSVEALCRSELDLVSVHSPPFLHREYVCRAIDAGHAVLCDKPFGASVDDAVAMTEAAEAAGVPNFVNFEFRHQPARIAMAELLVAGAVGSAEHLSYTALTSGSRVPLRRWGWLFDRSRGGGWIGAFGSHAIDLARWLLGDIVDTGATTWIHVTERPDAGGNLRRCDAEDAFVGWAETRMGATVTIDSSFTAGAPLTPRIVLVGSEGVIENIGDRRVVVRRSDGSSEQREFEPLGGDPHGEAMAAWTAAIREAVSTGRPIGPSFVDGLACARVMEQWRESLPSEVGGGGAGAG